MRCLSCDGIIEESDVLFCPFAARRSAFRAPVSRPSASAGLSTHPHPSSRRYFISHGSGIITSGGYGTSALPTSTAAIVSPLFGILGWFMAPVICSIIAIVAGHRARREIAASNERVGGSGYATAGIITGHIQLALIAFLCALLFVIFLLTETAGSEW